MERIYLGSDNNGFTDRFYETEYSGDLFSAEYSGEGPNQTFKVIAYTTVLLDVVTSDSIFEGLVLRPGDQVLATPQSCSIHRSAGDVVEVPRRNGGDGGISINEKRAHISFDRYEPNAPFVVLTHPAEDESCVIFRFLKNLKTLYGRGRHEKYIPCDEFVGTWLETVGLGVMNSPHCGSVEVRRYAGDQELNEESYKDFL